MNFIILFLLLLSNVSIHCKSDIKKKSLFISSGNIHIVIFIYKNVWYKYIIFEETKWCGAGNIASDCNDFGLYAETDKCCKS